VFFNGQLTNEILKAQNKQIDEIILMLDAINI
jgi:hypothetical protein